MNHFDKFIAGHFREILDLFDEGIYLSDRAGNTLMVNSSYENLTCLPKDDFVGKKVQELAVNGTFSTIVNPEVVRTGKSVTTIQEVNNRRVVLRGMPVFDEQGEVVLVVTFVRDITVFERLKNELIAQKDLLHSYQRQIAKFNPIEVFQDDGMVAVSEASLDLLKEIEIIAPTDCPVMIQGETGVGKDVVARKIHKKSSRTDKPLIKVDCSSIPEGLMESELYGYTPGAFSGAHSKGKEGYLEEANKGTLFLDEIGDLPLPMQTKLLRVIQDKEIIRVGSTKILPIDIRIICASNRNLEDEVAKGNFRSDLFFRLKVAVLHIKPLRSRKDDILPLAKIFLSHFNTKYDKVLSFSSSAEELLFNYNWPGNVRELENMIHSAVVKTTKQVISDRDLLLHLSKAGQGLKAIASSHHCFEIGKRSLKEIMQRFEQELISEALSITGSLGKASELLEVDRSTLYRKIKQAEKTEKQSDDQD